MNKYYTIEKRSFQKGFTILEVMVVIAIIAVTVMAAIPSFDTVIKNKRIENEAYRIFSMLKVTRSNAITSNRRHFLCRTTSALTSENGNGAACRSANMTNYDWTYELISYGLLSSDPETTPNGNFNNQRLQVVGSANSNDVKQQMLQNVSGPANDSVDIVSNSTDNVIAFTPEGALLNDAPIRIAICDDRGSPEDFGKLITINSAGLIRLTSTDASDTELDCSPAP